MEAPSAYNVILGRPSLNRIRAIVSTHALAVKFPTPQITGTLRGDQVVTRSCYATSLRREIRTETLAIEDPRDERDGMTPVKDIVQIVLDRSEEHTSELQAPQSSRWYRFTAQA